ncbi:YybH family protein [Flagellimonas iocasae]|uniref:YybH family protein n=1 Tax=Flagellimonas iocasae TaxID=2055905 RepID=A0ABW4XY60_9FLAO
MKDIEDFFIAYKNAVWQKNAAELLSLYDENVVSFDMWDRGYYKNLQEWSPEIEDWLDSLADEKVKVDFEMVVTHASETVGFASGLIRFRAISSDGTVLRGMKNRISVGFSKFGTKWKVVHQHISAPVTSENLMAVLNL